jgi:hypothetical protein
MTEDQFNLLSKEEQRVAIAKEVLGQFELKTLIASHGTYFGAETSEGERIVLFGQDAKSFIRNAPQEKTSCYACMLGSLFCGAASIKNNITFDIFLIGRYLSAWFTLKELALLELFFEGFTTECWSEELTIDLISDDEYSSLLDTYNGKQVPTERVKLALNHIIAINGAEITAEGLCKL